MRTGWGKNISFCWQLAQTKIVLLTLVEASMFSGSMSVLSRPISWTAPPNSGSESQIICLITTFISRTSYKTHTQKTHLTGCRFWTKCIQMKRNFYTTGINISKVDALNTVFCEWKWMFKKKNWSSLDSQNLFSWLILSDNIMTQLSVCHTHRVTRQTHTYNTIRLSFKHTTTFPSYNSGTNQL